MVPPFDEPLTVNTYHLEELTSTKLRALHDRRKGRAIYDLFRIADRDLNQAAVRKMVLYYLYRANKVFHHPTFVSNVELKIAERGFRDDVRSLVRHGTELDWETACQQVLAHFEFLGDLDHLGCRYESRLHIIALDPAGRHAGFSTEEGRSYLYMTGEMPEPAEALRHSGGGGCPSTPMSSQ